jgi:hypothetical protein
VYVCGCVGAATPQEEEEGKNNPDFNRPIRINEHSKKTGIVRDKKGNIIGAFRKRGCMAVRFVTGGLPLMQAQFHLVVSFGIRRVVASVCLRCDHRLR